MVDFIHADRPTLELALRNPAFGEPVKARIRARLAELDGSATGSPSRKPSSVPQHLQREKDVEQDIDYELERLGFDVVRLSQARASRQTEGTPDRYARHPRLKIRLWIEVKQPGGVVSADQKRWHKTERDAGGEVITVWSVRDLHEELRARGVPVDPHS